MTIDILSDSWRRLWILERGVSLKPIDWCSVRKLWLRIYCSANEFCISDISRKKQIKKKKEDRKVVFLFNGSNNRLLVGQFKYLHLVGLKIERLCCISNSKGSLWRRQSIISPPNSSFRHCAPFWLTNSIPSGPHREWACVRPYVSFSHIYYKFYLWIYEKEKNLLTILSPPWLHA